MLLNLWGTALMLLANAWVSYMMAPTGIDKETLGFAGTTWQAVANPLWVPLGIHRMIGNVAVGGFIVGAYAAVKFLGAASDTERAHYDWIRYVGNSGYGMHASKPIDPVELATIVAAVAGRPQRPPAS